MNSFFLALLAAAVLHFVVWPARPALVRADAACRDRRRPSRTPALSGAMTLLREQPSGRLDLADLAPSDFGHCALTGANAGVGLCKRIIDVSAALGLVVFCLPLLVVTAIAIKLDSSGPVLYRQKRIGFEGREFEIFKFRSMITDAEKDGVQWASKNDSRITRVGRTIRKTRIDEIPQVINILRGEMSFVGPRPERPEFVNLLEKEIPNYHLRHIVRPGITGWAQVRYVYGASVEDARIKLQYDLYYIKNFNLLSDFLIILKTVRVVLFGIGSR